MSADPPPNVACPYCGAAPDEECVTAEATLPDHLPAIVRVPHATRTHVARWRAALAAISPGESP